MQFVPVRGLGVGDVRGKWSHTHWRVVSVEADEVVSMEGAGHQLRPPLSKAILNIRACAQVRFHNGVVLF